MAESLQSLVSLSELVSTSSTNQRVRIFRREIPAFLSSYTSGQHRNHHTNAPFPFHTPQTQFNISISSNGDRFIANAALFYLCYCLDRHARLNARLFVVLPNQFGLFCRNVNRARVATHRYSVPNGCGLR